MSQMIVKVKIYRNYKAIIFLVIGTQKVKIICYTVSKNNLLHSK